MTHVTKSGRLIGAKQSAAVTISAIRPRPMDEMWPKHDDCAGRDLDSDHARCVQPFRVNFISLEGKL
jgi:hypothetical protein